MCILSLNRVALTFLHKIGRISVYFHRWKSLVTRIPLCIGAGTRQDTIALIILTLTLQEKSVSFWLVDQRKLSKMGYFFIMMGDRYNFKMILKNS